jgi:mRNA interferase YafQ
LSRAPLQSAYTSQFKKDWKRCQKAHLPMDELRAVMEKVIKRVPLEPKYKDHQLGGNNKDFRECHIRPDWLLAYMIKDGEITFTRTGGHAEWFGK